MNTSGILLEAEKVTLHYRGLSQPALREVSIRMVQGITLGIVGESGSGKSSLARCLLGVETISSGNIAYRGEPLAGMDRHARALFRRKVQLVFQDPYNSLNPRMTIGMVLREVLRVHRMVAGPETGARIRHLLDQVGLSAGVAERYPHELSGGQRQRVGIARALALNPEVIIADEPVSALDVSVQAHILNLLKDLVAQTGITLVLIAHDLAVVRYICREVVVMHQGRVVEQGAVEQVMDAPRHPYTQNLLASVPEW